MSMLITHACQLLSIVRRTRGVGRGEGHRGGVNGPRLTTRERVRDSLRIIEMSL